MWSSEVTNMIITGIWETLYMTLVSTLVGYVIGLPMGIILTVSDKDGIKPNAVLYFRCDRKYRAECTFYHSACIADPIYKISRRKELWFHGNNRSTCDRSSTIYCQNG